MRENFVSAKIMYPKRSDGPITARSKTPSGMRSGPGGSISGAYQISEEALAKERDQKFKVWLQNKALKDKAFEVCSISLIFFVNNTHNITFP